MNRSGFDFDLNLDPVQSARAGRTGVDSSVFHLFKTKFNGPYEEMKSIKFPNLQGSTQLKNSPPTTGFSTLINSRENTADTQLVNSNQPDDLKIQETFTFDESATPQVNLKMINSNSGGYKPIF